MVYVDAGNGLVPAIRKNHGDLGVAERIKAELILETARADAIDGLVIGEADWRLGRDWVVEHAQGLPVLAANLTCDGSSPFPGARVVERAGLKIGLVGVTTGEVPGCEVAEPLEAAAMARKGIDVDFAIALMPLRLLRTTREQDLGFDLIVSGGEPVTYEQLEPFLDGLKAASGGKTKHIGALELTLVPGGDGWEQDPTIALRASIDKTTQLLERVRGRVTSASTEAEKERLGSLVARYESTIAEQQAEVEALRHREGPKKHKLVNRIDALDESLSDHEQTARRLADAKARVTDEGSGGADLSALSQVPRFVPGGGVFAGSDSCQGCHPEPTAQWSRTGHSRAYAGLVAVDRAMDPECYSCHVTGAGEEGGPKGPAHVGPFRDVQCESCHGPSGAHARAGGQVPPGRPQVTEATCVTCHDGERDMGRFEYERYLPRVTHKDSRTE